MTKPKEGDMVLHHGRLHEIIGFRNRYFKGANGKPAVASFAFCKNAGFQPVCESALLKWSAKDKAWYLPGRVLSKDERTVINAMVGSWPKAEAHMAVRSMLDVEGPLADHVNMEDLEKIVRARRLRRGYDLRLQKTLKDGVVLTKSMSKAKLQRTLEGCETAEAFDKRVKKYTKEVITHCEQLRAFRAGEPDVPLPPKDGSFESVKIRRVPGGGPYKIRKEKTNG